MVRTKLQEAARHPDPEAWQQQGLQAQADAEVTLKNSSQMIYLTSWMRDLPNVLEDADKPKGGEPSTSKSVGKEGEAQTEGQATEGAQAPPEGIPPAPIPVSTTPQPGTSTGPTQDPTDDPAQDPTQTTGEVEIKLTQYVKDYRAAGKVWLDTVVQEEEKAYHTLYDRLQQLGAPHKGGLDQADRQQVHNCIKDRTGMFLSQDENVKYVETEEELEKPKIRFTGEAKEALKNHYDVTQAMCSADRLC